MCCGQGYAMLSQKTKKKKYPKKILLLFVWNMRGLDFLLFFELSKCISLILVDFYVFVTLYDIMTPTDLMCFLPTTKNLIYKIYMSI